jgi:glycosyltransferase involved in cell wall biosynthesis
VFGGIEHTMRLISRGLVAMGGFEVSVLCASGEPRTRTEVLEGVEVVRLATFGRLARTPVSPGFPAWIRRMKPDLLHFHYPHPTGEMACLLAAPRCPVVVTYHADVIRQRRIMQVYRHALVHFLRRADRILVTSPVALEGNEILRPHLDRCRVLPLGISLDRMRETDRTREVAARLRRELPGPVTLFVGRIRPYKGLPVLIEAMKGVPGSLVLVGRGEEEKRVARLVREGGLADRVHMAGDVPDGDLAGYYRAADLFVLPSVHRSEAFGLAMVEAMSCGLPVISTRLGTGTSFVNRAGETGLEVEPGNPAELADAMRLLLSDRELAARLGAGGARRSRMFTDQAMIANTAAVYRELAGPRT